MNTPRQSYTDNSGRVGLAGLIKLTTIDRDGFSSVSYVKNLETDYVLQAITKALSGEAAIPATGTGSIVPVSMAVGSGMTPVTNSSTALDSELLRKTVMVTRTGNKITYAITLTTGEALGQIGSLGLFGVGGSSGGSSATGSLTLGGTAVVGQLIKVTLDGRGIPAYYVGSTTLSVVATGLANWLNGDGDFGSLYACAAAGSVISVNSKGQGTVYNANAGVSVTGTITASITGMTGGTTPGGQLLAAANTYFRKERNTQLLIEWTISISN